jgi:hypothetical protein
MFERNVAGFKVNHLGWINITRWSKKGKPELILDMDGKIRSKFLEE